MPGAGKVGNLILAEAGVRQGRPSRLVKPGFMLGVQFDPALGQLHPERRVFLESKAIRRKVVRLQPQRLRHIRQPSGLALSRQCKHEVEIHAGKTRRPDAFVGAVNLRDCVLSAQRIQQIGLETLHSHGDAGDAQFLQHRQPRLGHRGRGQLHRPLFRCVAGMAPHQLAEAAQIRRGQQPRGAAAPENRRHRTRP